MMGQQGSGDLVFSLDGVTIQLGSGKDDKHDLPASSSISSSSTISASPSIVLGPISITQSPESPTIATTTLQTIVTETETVFVKETGSLQAVVNGTSSEYDTMRESSQDGTTNPDRTVLKISIALGTVVGLVLLGLLLIGFMKFTRWRRRRRAPTKEDQASLLPVSQKAVMEGPKKWWGFPPKKAAATNNTTPLPPPPTKKRSASSIMNELMRAVYVAEGDVYPPQPREGQIDTPKRGLSRRGTNRSLMSWTWRSGNGYSLKSSRSSRKSALSAPPPQGLSRDTSFRDTKDLPPPPPAALSGDSREDARSSVWTKDTRDITVWARTSVFNGGGYTTTEVSQERKPEPSLPSMRGGFQARGVSAWSSSDTASRYTKGSLSSEW